MAGESSSRRDTSTLCRRSHRLAALYSLTKPVSEEKVVIEISDDSVQKEDTDLEQTEVEPVAEAGGRVDLPKNDVYDALWAMLDAESDNEAAEVPGEWDLDSTLLIWGRNEPDAEFRAEVAGESERNERIATKPRRPLLDQMRTHQWSHAYASYTWEARPKGYFGTDAYTFRASMRTHQWFSASINRGPFRHFKGAHFHI
ncbi:hypothetical protein PIB30_059637 [Stylosanthes scabra]|uniref:Uncharacterized protein n=1 Tax=Stylosanthes scabra TaxID=79078 RepID=A0ABU6XI84_9FABA|nr:hypothetical protein [Stylosanthes scabra]